MVVRKYKVRANHRGESKYDYVIDGLSDDDKFPVIPKKYKHILFENCFIEKPITLHNNVKSISFYESYVKFSKFPENLNELIYRSCDYAYFPKNFKDLAKFRAITMFRFYADNFSIKLLPESTQYISYYSLDYDKNLKKLPRDIKSVYLNFYVDTKKPTIEKYHESFINKKYSS